MGWNKNKDAKKTYDKKLVEKINQKYPPTNFNSKYFQCFKCQRLRHKENK